jgi:pimeloyl-ACP methyl ester carboxylesterase
VAGPVTASTLFSRRAGSGDRMVLVHALGSSSHAWNPILAALVAEREVLALDLPGFGRSAPLPAGVPPTVPALADAVEQAVDAAGFETAHIVGNSIGGWIALELARRGRARSVVAISPAGAGSPEERVRIVAAAVRTYAAAQLLAPWAAVLPGLVASAAFLFSEVHSRPWRVRPEDALQAVLGLAGSLAFLETLEWTVGRHQPEGLAEVRCPVLLAWGSEDRILAPSHAAQFVDAIPGAQHLVLPGVGHIPMSDDPDLVAAMILDFTGQARLTR